MLCSPGSLMVFPKRSQNAIITTRMVVPHVVSLDSQISLLPRGFSLPRLLAYCFIFPVLPCRILSLFSYWLFIFLVLYLCHLPDESSHLWCAQATTGFFFHVGLSLWYRHFATLGPLTWPTRDFDSRLHGQPSLSFHLVSHGCSRRTCSSRLSCFFVTTAASIYLVIIGYVL